MFDVMILMIGTFIDVSPAILLLTPIMLPVMQNYGFSPLQFGAMMITGLAIGLVTPPVGMCVCTGAQIGKISAFKAFKATIPFLATSLIVLMLVSFIPQLTLWIPSILN